MRICAALTVRLLFLLWGRKYLPAPKQSLTYAQYKQRPKLDPI